MIRIEAPGGTVQIGRGLIDEIGALLPPGRRFIVTDENVAAVRWSERVAGAFSDTLMGSHILAPGEKNKNLRCLEALVDGLIEARIERDDQVIAVGGGMVGDMAGFAAAIVKRGCRFVQVPTSLLAQVDAAIGGKSGINARQGKNLIGAFHRPAAVIIDIAALATLPERELRAGYAEIVKYGLIGDTGFFKWCEGHGAALLAGDEQARLHAIETAVRAKVAVVERDERDLDGLRALLNFGHSFGHAIEAETGMAHGEAVALGMVLAFRLSAERGLCPTDDADRVAAHLDAVGLPTRLETVDPARLVARMAHDKKMRGGRLRLVLARRIGQAFLDDSVTPKALLTFLERSAGVVVA